MFLTIGSLKVDYTGECLLSTNEGESEGNDIFSADLKELLVFLIFDCTKIFDTFLINRISFRMNCHYVHLRCDKSAIKVL